MQVRQADRKIGLSAAVAAALSNQRAPERITDSLRNLVAQLSCTDFVAATRI